MMGVVALVAVVGSNEGSIVDFLLVSVCTRHIEITELLDRSMKEKPAITQTQLGTNESW